MRVNNTWSDPLPVHGGVPQGSILGVLLFNVSTNDLEDDQNDDLEFVHSDDEDSTVDSASTCPSSADPVTDSGGISCSCPRRPAPQ